MSVKRKQTRCFSSYTEDFVETRDQNAKVPADYPWIPNRFLSGLVYGIAIAFSAFYLPLGLHVRYVNRRVLKEGRKTGAFLYCNHTQPFGDVFLPALPAVPGRIYTVVSPANLGIPVIGRILPYLGGLPIPDTIAGMKRFTETMERRLGEKRYITIFPEAHVWEYYTGIRTYPDTSFKYPVKYEKPAYCLTVTYQKRRWGSKPGTTVYIDGPFLPDPALPPKARAARLHDQIYACMQERSRNSNYAYISYEYRENETPGTPQ